MKSSLDLGIGIRKEKEMVLFRRDKENDVVG